MLKSKGTKVQDCYKDELKSNPTLRGTVTVSFNITASDGKPKSVGVTGMNSSIQACVKQEVARWKFRNLNQDANGVRYKYVLQPG